MLYQLLHLLKENQQSCPLGVLSRKLNAQPGAVEAMLDTLVRSGRVVVIEPNGSPCEACALSGKCDLPIVKGRRYALASRDPSHYLVKGA